MMFPLLANPMPDTIVDSVLIYRERSVHCVQTKPHSPLCYTNRSNEKTEGEGGGRHVSAHEKTKARRAPPCLHLQCKRKDSFPFLVCNV